jgi:sRNA-binding carbon storage regulator CsrA
MLILSRHVGDALIIGDVVVTLKKYDAKSAEMSLTHQDGEASEVLVLNRDQPAPGPHDTHLVYIERRQDKIRLGIEVPHNVPIHRK